MKSLIFLLFILSSFSFFIGSDCYAQVPEKITNCSLYFSDEVNALLERDAKQAIVKFSFQDDKIKFYEYYQELRRRHEQKQLQAKSNVFTKALEIFKVKKNELSLVETQELNKLFPDIKKPREIFSPKIERRGASPVLIDADIALVPYSGHPDTNELELRDLQTGRLISYLEWDEPDFGMFDIDDFIHIKEERTVILHSNSFFGKTKESSDKDIFYRWNYKTGQTQKLFIDRNFQKTTDQFSQGGSRFNSKMSKNHPYMLRGSSPVSDGVNVQIINYQDMKALAISDADFKTYEIIGYNNSHFSAQSRYMLYLRKAEGENYKKSFVLLPFEHIENAMIKDEILIGADSQSAARTPLLFEHKDPLVAVKSSPSGRMIISATVAGDIVLWRANNASSINKFNVSSREAQLNFNSDETFATIFDRKENELHVINLLAPENKVVLKNFDYPNISSLTFLDNKTSFLFVANDHNIYRVEAKSNGTFSSTKTDIELPRYQVSPQKSERNQKMFFNPSGDYILALSKESKGFDSSYWLEVYDIKAKRYLGSELISQHDSWMSYSLSEKRDFLAISTKDDGMSVVKIDQWIKQLREKTDKP